MQRAGGQPKLDGQLSSCSVTQSGIAYSSQHLVPRLSVLLPDFCKSLCDVVLYVDRSSTPGTQWDSYCSRKNYDCARSIPSLGN